MSAGLKRPRKLCLLVVGLLPLAPLVVSADDDHEQARRLLEAGEVLPLEAVIERVQTVQPGTVIDAELEREDDRLIYEIELLDRHGIVHEVLIDAATGGVLETETGD